MSLIYAFCGIGLCVVVYLIGYCVGCDEKAKQYERNGLYLPPEKLRK